MPSKTEKQRRLIYAVRNKYKSKSKTPKKWKWVWGDEWLKIKESNIIKNFKDFNESYKTI